MDINSTFVAFHFKVCLNDFYVGMVVGYVALSLSFFLGTPAHSWLLWLYLRTGWKIKPTQVFPVNMIILELTFCMQCAVQILNVLMFNSDMLWKMASIVFGLCWVGRPLMQMCICVEQYLAVLHPIIFLKYKCMHYRIVCAAVVWLMAAGYAVYEAFADTFPDNIFNSVFVISMIVISFCCVSVLRALKHPGPGDTQMEKGRDIGNQQKRNAFNTIFSGLLIILFTSLPQVSVSLIDLLEMDKKLFHCNVVPFMTAFISGVMITPLLKMYKYNRKSLKCQREIKENS